MPVFNHPDLVKVMIDSILANNFLEWELLAVDDGSDAPTLELLETYTEADSRIRLVHRDRLPKGAQTCRNMGLEQAKGEFVAFFDSDDYVMPHCLETRVRHLSQRPELDFMVFPSGVYREDAFHAEDFPFVFGYPVFADDLTAFVSRTLPFVVWNNLYRREALQLNDIQWDEQLKSLQDCDFNVLCLLKGLHYDYATTLPDYGYRNQVTGSVTQKSKSEEHFQNTLYAQEKFYQNMPQGYKRALFVGILNLYKRMFPDSVDMTRAGRLKDVVMRYDKWRGTLMCALLASTSFLNKFLKSRTASRWALAPFLIYSYFLSHRLTHRRQQLYKQYITIQASFRAEQSNM